MSFILFSIHKKTEKDNIKKCIKKDKLIAFDIGKKKNIIFGK
ncbi:hypothetical protein [Candidatus Ruminimicrobium bovinum]